MPIKRYHRPYGFCVNEAGQTAIQPQEAEVVREIFRLYLEGNSLGKIAERLHEKGIVSPSGEERWQRASIDHVLSNKWYAGYIVDQEYFIIVQAEKKSRAEHETGTLLQGKDVLSGLLVCAECGAKYRRITRPSGEIVWRCANRVEYGKKICKTAPTISDKDIRAAICRELGMSEFDGKRVKYSFSEIRIHADGIDFDRNSHLQWSTER